MPNGGGESEIKEIRGEGGERERERGERERKRGASYKDVRKDEKTTGYERSRTMLRGIC